MNLKRWNREVLKGRRTSGASLIVDLIFLCSHCRRDSTVSVGPFAFNLGATGILSFLAQEVEKNHRCVLCGFTAPIAKEDKEKFFREVQKSISPNWLKANLF